MKRRILSTLLALCLVLGILPGEAFAMDANAEESTQQQGNFDNKQSEPIALTDVVASGEQYTGEEAAEPVELSDRSTSGACGKNATWSLIDGILTISGNGPMADYTHYAPWFRERESIVSVVINSGITSIGAYAFYMCSSLTSTTIPDSVTLIGNSAFSGCSRLMTITIPDSVTSIGEYAFCDCTSLTSITIPDGVTSIGDGAGGGAFSGCSSLTSISIPDSVTLIGGGAFYRCSSLTSITIPDSVTSIGDWAFYECNSLTSVTMPASRVDTFGSYCTSVTHVRLTGKGNMANAHGGSKNTPWYASSEAGNNVNVEIEDGVTSIGDFVFANCNDKVNIHIPQSVQMIGKQSFYRCQSPNLVIPGNIIAIGDYAFEGCSGLTNINISEGLTAIGNGQFVDCIALSSIDLPDSVTSIGDGAFARCSNLTDVRIPNSLTSLGPRAFAHCGKLSSITIPDNINRIEEYTFIGCSSLNSVNISNRINSIGAGAFSGCANLTNLVVPDSVTYIGGSAFHECIGLTDISIPAQINSSGRFSGCVNVTKVQLTGKGPMFDYTLSDNGTAYSGTPWNAGSTAGNSVTVEIGEEVTSIGRYAFWGCKGLREILVPISVTRIGYDAFYGCNTMKDVFYSGSKVHWDAMDFENNTKYLTAPTVTIHYNGSGPDQPIGPGGDGITFEKEQYSVYTDDETTLRAYITYNGEQLPEGYVTCRIADKSIAEVVQVRNMGTTAYITIRGIANGVTTITAITPDGKGASCEISVKTPPNEIKISGRKSLLLGSSDTLSADVKFNTIVVGDEIVWTSSNGDVLAFDENGKTTVNHPITDWGMTSDSVTVYSRSTGAVTITCKMPLSNVEKSFDVLVFEDESLDFKELISDFEKAYNSYIKKVASTLKANQNSVSYTTIDQQAAALMEQDNGRVKLITFQDKYDETVQKNVYKAAAMFLADATNEFDFGSIKVSGVDINSLTSSIVSALQAGLDFKPYSYKLDGNVTVMFEGFGGGANQVRMITYKRGNSKPVHIADLVSKPDQIRGTIKKYLEDLAMLEKNLVKEACSQVTKEFVNLGFKGLKTMTKEGLTELLGVYTDAFAKTGVGKVATAISVCVDYYNYADKIISLADKDPFSLMSDLSSMKTLSFEPKSINDKAVAMAMKGLDEAGNTLNKAVEEFIRTGSVDLNKILKGWADDTASGVVGEVKCPVNVSVYNTAGVQVGYVGDDDIWYDADTIRIEKYSDKKVIYSHDTSLRYEIVATDYGTLNCTFEEYSGGTALVRVNYYDIPLYKGKNITAVVPDHALSEERIIVSEGDDRISADESIPANQYNSMTATIACEIEPLAGGQVFGTGTFVRGDAINLQATVADGYRFMGWQDEDGMLIATETTYEFTAKEDVRLTALYAKLEKKLALYFVTFDATGGILAPNILATEVGGAFISVPTPVREGFTFDGWYTALDGGEQITTETVFTEDTTVYAHWTQNTTPTPKAITITFDSNGGTGTMADITATENIAVTLPNCTFTAPTGRTFKAWQINGKEYVPGETYTFTADTTVIAIWQDISVIPPIHTTCTITFDPTGGITSTSSMTTGPDGKLAALPTAIRDSYTFTGWYSALAGGERISTDTVFSSDATVYAHWSYVGGPTDGGWIPSGGSSSPATYRITIPSVSHGTVTVNPKSATKGSTVTVAATPDSGYELTALTVTDSRGNELELVDKGNGRYTFAMPNSAVTIDAVFEPVQQPELLPEANPAWVNPFTDVTPTSWYYDAVKFVSENHLMNGVGSNLFAPDAVLSRAQMAQLLYNKESNPTVSGNSIFTDVPDGAWYADAIAWASGKNIVGGYGNGTFGPNDSVTREQLAVMLWRYADEPVSGGELSFTDAAQVSDYALTAIRWAVENGVLNGTGNGVLDPKGYATRAQVAQMLKNYLNN